MAASAATLATSRTLLAADSMSFPSEATLSHMSREQLNIETDSEMFQIDPYLQEETSMPSVVRISSIDRVSSMDSDIPSPRPVNLPSPANSTGSSLLSPTSSISIIPPFSLPTDRRYENLRLRRQSGISPSHARGHSSDLSAAQPSPPVSPHCPSPTGVITSHSFSSSSTITPNPARSSLSRAPWSRASLTSLPSSLASVVASAPSAGPTSSAIPIPSSASGPVNVRSTLNLTGVQPFAPEQNLSARSASQRLSSSPILRPFSSIPPSSHSSTSSSSFQPPSSLSFSSLGPSAATATSSPMSTTRDAKIIPLSAIKPRTLGWNANTPVKVNHSIAVPSAAAESPHENRRFPNGLYIQASHSAHNLRQSGPGSAGGHSEKGLSPKRPSSSQNSSPVTKRLCASPAPNFNLDGDYPPSSSGGAPVPVGGPSRSSSSDDLDSDISSPPQSGELSMGVGTGPISSSMLPSSVVSAVSPADIASPVSTSTPVLVRPDASGFDDDTVMRRKPRTCASAGNTPRMVAKRCPPTPSGKAPSPLLQRDATLFQYGGIPPLPAPPVASTPLRARSNSHSHPVASPPSSLFPVPRPVDRESGFTVPASAPRSLLFSSLSDHLPPAPPSTVSSTRSIMSLSTQATPMSFGAEGDLSPPAPTGLGGDDCSVLSGTGDTEAVAESAVSPGYPNVPTFASSAPNQLSNYEKIESIGAGSFGEVWRVRDLTSNRIVALKKHTKPSESLSSVATLQRQHARVASLLPHENILKYEICFQQDGHIYDVSELCSRGTLDHHVHCLFGELNQNNPFSPTPLSEVALWDIVLQTANGLVRLKQGHLLHLDIKPENLFVTEDGIIKIGDFGTSVPREEWSENCLEGDQRYLAPELLDHQTGRVDYSADVYSLGVSLYELITDIEMPKNGDQWHVVRSNTIERPTIFFENPVFQISEQVRRLVIAMMDRDPTKRPSPEQIFELAVSRMLQLGGQPRTMALPPPPPYSEQFPVSFLPPSSPAPQPPPAPNRRRARSASRSKTASRQTLLISPSANLLPAPPATAFVPAGMVKPRPVAAGLAPRPVAPLVECISTVTKSSVRALISQARPRVGALADSNPIAPDPSGFEPEPSAEVNRSLQFDSDDESDEKGAVQHGRSLGRPFRSSESADPVLAAPSILPMRPPAPANPRGSESPGMHSALMNGVSKLQLT